MLCRSASISRAIAGVDSARAPRLEISTGTLPGQHDALASPVRRNRGESVLVEREDLEGAAPVLLDPPLREEHRRTAVIPGPPVVEHVHPDSVARRPALAPRGRSRIGRRLGPLVGETRSEDRREQQAVVPEQSVELDEPGRPVIRDVREDRDRPDQVERPGCERQGRLLAVREHVQRWAQVGLEPRDARRVDVQP